MLGSPSHRPISSASCTIRYSLQMGDGVPSPPLPRVSGITPIVWVLWVFCDTPHGLKPSGFCLSRVVGTLRNVAWLRLCEYRSWQGKARKKRIHPCVCSPGRCHARCRLHALRKGKDGPQLALSASWETPTPASLDAAPLGTYPQGRRLFLSYAVSCNTS